ncbi:hypothetical protein N7497_005034, partial [Penicillium chrysogenum]
APGLVRSVSGVSLSLYQDFADAALSSEIPPWLCGMQDKTGQVRRSPTLMHKL